MDMVQIPKIIRVKDLKVGDIFTCSLASMPLMVVRVTDERIFYRKINKESTAGNESLGRNSMQRVELVIDLDGWYEPQYIKLPIGRHYIKK